MKIILILKRYQYSEVNMTKDKRKKKRYSKETKYV